VDVRKQRRDGAVVAHVSCNGADAAAEQVRRGMASVSVDADAHLGALQAEARATKRGVWSAREAQVQRVDR
jgi:endonuclease YncB( thermonuclease family)